jgi:hypothetical protein
MHHRIDSLRGPNPLDSSSAKVGFYIFHVFPEWLVILFLFLVNVRKTFGTGHSGDWRWRDETPKQKEKRLVKQAKQEEKKMGNIRKGSDDSVYEKEKLGQNELVTLVV